MSVNDSATTLGTFFNSMITRIQGQTGVAANRVFVVDKLRLQDSNIPNFQIEPVAMTILGDECGVNAFDLRFKVHAVTKTEYDFADKPTQKLVKDASQKGAFQYAVDVATALNKWETAGSENMVILGIENGGVDDVTGLSHATASFRTFLRAFADG